MYSAPTRNSGKCQLHLLVHQPDFCLLHEMRHSWSCEKLSLHRKHSGWHSHWRGNLCYLWQAWCCQTKCDFAPSFSAACPSCKSWEWNSIFPTKNLNRKFHSKRNLQTDVMQRDWFRDLPFQLLTDSAIHLLMLTKRSWIPNTTDGGPVVTIRDDTWPWQHQVAKYKHNNSAQEVLR